MGAGPRGGARLGYSIMIRFTCAFPGRVAAIRRAARLPLIAAAFAACGAARASEPPPAVEPAAPRYLRLVYFTPADREPYPDHRGRVTRIMKDIQEFYRVQMDRNGWGPRTFSLQEDTGGQVLLHEVRGAQPADYYTFHRGHELRAEVGRALRAQGIPIDEETIVIFMAVLNFEEQPDGRIRISGDCPYYGSGSFLGGTGWFNDDPGMDAARFRDATPVMIYKNADIPRGRLNSVLIGGIAHELGHALGMPHIKETEADRRAGRGTALMGSGNYTYREELRNEGPGSFLTAAEAAMLAHHPLFDPQPSGSREQPRATLTRFTLRHDPAMNAFHAEGQWSRTMPLHSVVFLNDDWGGGTQNQGDDYDAVGWACRADPDGSFRCTLGELKPGNFEMRLVACHVNGALSRAAFRYTVDAQGIPDIRDMQNMMAEITLRDRFRAEDIAGLQAWAAREGESELPEEARAALKDWLAARTGAAALPSLADIPADSRRVSLGEVAWDDARVGWIRPMRNSIPDRDMPLIFAGGHFYRRGLYAHAPAGYTFTPAGQWKWFSSGAGMQTGQRGQVVFVVRGDGRELFRSRPMQDPAVETVRVDISGVQRLELVVEDAGDTNRSDWAVWLDPALER